MPPHSVLTPISMYCRCDSSVSCVISFEWSTGKMKFDACPVEPPGFGSGPLSIRTTSVQPSSGEVVREAVADDAAADHDGSGVAREGAHGVDCSSSCGRWSGSEDGADRPLEAFDVAAHDGLGARRIAVADRLQQLAVLGDGVVEPRDAVEREEPDPQRQDVVLVQRRLDERVVRAAVDVPVDALVELDQRPLVACVGDGRAARRGARARPRGRRRSRARRRGGRRSSRARSAPRTARARSPTSTGETTMPRRG